MSIALTLLGIFLMVLGLGVSIALHELGHLVPAKLFKVKVTQYMIGFGPTIYSRTKGETEYGIKALPLGGYIRMIGMYPPPKAQPEKITADSPGFFGRLSKEAKEAELASYHSADSHRTFVSLSVPKKLVVMLGGPVMNLVLSAVLFTISISFIGTGYITTEIQSVSLCVIPASSTDDSCEGMPKAPAYAAGLKPGDIVKSVNSVAVEDFTKLSLEIRKYPGQEIPMEIERGNQRLNILATPIGNEVVARDQAGNVLRDSQGKYLTETAGFLGITGTRSFKPQPITKVPGQVFEAFWQTSKVVFALPVKMAQVAEAAFLDEARDPNGPIGIVGVSRLAGEVVAADGEVLDLREKASVMVSILASLNMALFVFNLIPLMPLDGGHVLGALIEAGRKFIAKLRGREDPGPVDMSKLLPLTYVVVLFFLTMTILLLYVDIFKPISIFSGF